MSRLNRCPRKLRIMDGRTSNAWWYENQRNVEIHVESDGCHAVLTIPRGKLKDWINRTGGRGEGHG